MPQSACTRIRKRRVPTSLFSIMLDGLIPGPQIIEDSTCGAPLFTWKERRKQTCTNCQSMRLDQSFTQVR